MSPPTCRVHEGPDAQDVVPAAREAHVPRRVPPTGPGGVRGVRVAPGPVLQLSPGLAAVPRRRRGPELVPQYAADGAHRRHGVLVAHAVRQQPVPDLPGEDARVAPLVVPDAVDHHRGGDPRLAAADGPRQHGAGVVEAREDLGHAAVGHAQLAADVARPHAKLRELHDAQAHWGGQRPAVHEHPAELVHLPVAQLWRPRHETR